MNKNLDTKVLEKIRKLLSLAESDNEHEASIAMQRANELILRHNLSAQDICDSSVISHETEIIKTAAIESKWIYSILTKHFFVRILQKSVRGGYSETGRRIFHKKYCFIGEPLNIEVAQYTDSFLRQTYKRLWREYKALNQCTEKSRQSYYAGLTGGILEKLEIQKSKVQTETGLVWKGSSAIDKFVRENIGRVRKGSTSSLNLDDGDAISAGKTAGRNLELTRALKRNHQATESGRYLRS